jgi:hypothetical protein
MKKDVSSWLRRVAERLPRIFEEFPDTYLAHGWELKLTPVADQMELVDDQLYTVPIPKYVSVDHRHQLKDAYKRGGEEAVAKYCLNVLRKYKSATGAGSYENQEFVS